MGVEVAEDLVHGVLFWWGKWDFFKCVHYWLNVRSMMSTLDNPIFLALVSVGTMVHKLSTDMTDYYTQRYNIFLI